MRNLREFKSRKISSGANYKGLMKMLHRNRAAYGEIFCKNTFSEYNILISFYSAVQHTSEGSCVIAIGSRVSIPIFATVIRKLNKFCKKSH